MTEKVSTWCVPSAHFCAETWMIHEGVPVRIAVQRIKEGENHVQAEAKIDGLWHPLTEIWDGVSMAVIPYGRNYPGLEEPYRYMELDEFFNEQWQLYKR